VPRLIFRKSAEADLEAIADYTLERWGGRQCDRYLDGLQALFQRLLDEPGLGRPYSRFLRIEHVSHVVFFRREANGDVRVVRVLHKRMLPELHFDPARDDDE